MRKRNLKLASISALLFFSLGIKSYALDTEFFQKAATEVIESSSKVYWEQFGPGNSGYNEAVFPHPTDPNYVYSFPDMFNSYISIDGGRSYNTVLDEDLKSNNLDQISRVEGLDFSRQNENFGMVATMTGLWGTEDKGHSWYRIEVNPNTTRHFLGWMLPRTHTMSAIAVDPNNDNIWYAGSGDFWNVKSNHTTHRYMHGKSPQNAGKLYKTEDKGKTWTLLNNTGIHDKAEFGQIYINPNNSNIIFTVTTYGLYKSIDGGKSFNKIETIEDGNGQHFDLVRDMDMHVDPNTEEVTLFAINQIRYEPNEETKSIESVGGIYKSVDLGETWQCINGNLGLPYKDVLENMLDLYGSIPWYHSIGTSFNKYFAGSEVTNIQNNYPNAAEKLLHNYNVIKVDPTNKDIIYLMHNSSHTASPYLGDIWKSEDGGNTWIIATRIGYGWNDQKEFWESINQPTALNVEQHQEGKTYSNMIYSSQSARDLNIDSEGNVYVSFRTLVKSTDKGDTWQQLDVLYTEAGNMVGTGGSNLPGGYIITDERDENLMYLVSGENHLFKRMDDGESVKKGGVSVQNFHGSPVSPGTVAISPADINTMYMTVMRQKGQGEFFKSIDAGESWTSISKIYDTKSLYTSFDTNSLIIDPRNPSTMYFAIPAILAYSGNSAVNGGNTAKPIPKGVYKSTDEGKTWFTTNSGLPSSNSVYDLEFDPKNYDTLYAAVTTDVGLGVSNSSFDTALNGWTITGNVKAATLQDQTGVEIIGNNASISQKISNLKPNTKYALTALGQVSPGETGVLQVKSLAGDLMAESTFNYEQLCAEAVVFTTEPNQTSVVIVATKLNGDGSAYFDLFSVRPTGGLYKSLDAGANWNLVESFPSDITQINDVSIDKNNGKIYVSGGDSSSNGQHGGIWVSEDNGLTWDHIFAMPKALATSIDPHNPDRLLTIVKGNMTYDFLNMGVYYSENAGQTWLKINEGFGNSAQIQDVSFDPSPLNANTIWATSYAGGFFKGTIK